MGVANYSMGVYALLAAVLALYLIDGSICAQQGADPRTFDLATTPIALYDLNGKRIKPASPGKVVLLNFWATWCGPCRDEIPVLVGLQAKYKKHLQIIGLMIDDDKDRAQELAKKLGINYPLAVAPSGFRDLYGGVPAVPTSLIFSNHKMVTKCIGMYAFAPCESEIRSLLDRR